MLALNDWLAESEDNAKILFGFEQAYHAGRPNLFAQNGLVEKAQKRLLRMVRRRQRPLALRLAPYAAAAAVMVLAIGLMFTHKKPEPYTIVAQGSEVQVVDLSDGTRVWLKPGSTFSYPQDYAVQNRRVELQGEAYFEVAKDSIHPFVVMSPALEIKVRGTRFNLRSETQSPLAEASLIEGSIEVKAARNGGKIVLVPGQRAELDLHSGIMTVKQVNAHLDAVWHNNLITFSNATFFDIAQSLELLYDVNIVIPPHTGRDKTYSGSLAKKSQVEEILTLLQHTIPFDFHMEGDTIFVD